MYSGSANDYTLYDYTKKYGKYELIEAYKNGTKFSTANLTNGDTEAAEASFGFATNLPTTTEDLGSKMDTWISKAGNINKILQYCVNSNVTISNFDTKYPNGKVIVEPMFLIRLGEYYHVLTLLTGRGFLQKEYTQELKLIG